MPSAQRSMKRISDRDLARLAEVAARDRAEFFSRRRGFGSRLGDVLCVALCQGAAVHYVDGKNGIKDFDVWTFYRRRGAAQFPPRRVASRDFGNAKFGRSPDRRDFVGRRVDLLGRSINVKRGESPIVALRRYLTEAKTASARCLADKAIVVLEPARLRGLIAWAAEAHYIRAKR